MTAQDIDIEHAICVNKIVALKGKTTRKKPIHMSGDIVKIPKELIKLQKEVFVAATIFFVNGVPLFISLSPNTTFTAVGHLEERKSITTFKHFKEIYMHHLKITAL